MTLPPARTIARRASSSDFFPPVFCRIATSASKQKSAPAPVGRGPGPRAVEPARVERLLAARQAPDEPLPDVVGRSQPGAGPDERLDVGRQALLDPGLAPHRGKREVDHLVDELPVGREVRGRRRVADGDLDGRLAAGAVRAPARDRARSLRRGSSARRAGPETSRSTRRPRARRIRPRRSGAGRRAARAGRRGRLRRRRPEPRCAGWPGARRRRPSPREARGRCASALSASPWA